MSGDLRLSYVVQGSGLPVILIGAYGMSAASWLEDGYIDALAIDHRVIALDPLGTGHSDAPLEVEAYADDRLVEHVSAVIEAEHARGAVLWGYGRGAAIAQLYARRRPRDLALVVFAGEYLGSERAQMGTLDSFSSVGDEELIAALETDEWTRVWDVLPGTPDWLRLRVERDNDPWVFATVLRASRLRPPGFLRSSVPTVAIWGSGAPYHQLNSDIVESVPIDFDVVPGDAEAYLGVDAMLEAVRPYLARVAARRG